MDESRAPSFRGCKVFWHRAAFENTMDCVVSLGEWKRLDSSRFVQCFLPGKMEAIIDLRNLLAEGYVPVVGQDGQTVYLVQSARSVRGGVAFTF